MLENIKSDVGCSHFLPMILINKIDLLGFLLIEVTITTNKNKTLIAQYKPNKNNNAIISSTNIASNKQRVKMLTLKKVQNELVPGLKLLEIAEISISIS